MSMKFNRVKAMSVMAAAAAAIALTACGNSGTISSLTDSDSTASIAEGAAVEQPAVLSASISAAESAVSSVPEIVPQTVAATEVTSAPAADLTAAAPDEEVSGTGNTYNAAPLTSTAATAASTASEAESEAELLADNAEPTAAPEESTYEPAGEGNTGYITGDEVNVRETPTTDDGDDNVLFTLFEGDEVKILESADGWYKVEVDGETGWVNASFVE